MNFTRQVPRRSLNERLSAPARIMDDPAQMNARGFAFLHRAGAARAGANQPLAELRLINA